MSDRYLIDLFGELKLTSFEEDKVELDIDSVPVRLKKRLLGLLQEIRNNIKRVITITMGIFAVIVLAFSVITIIYKKKKQQVKVVG